MALRVLVEKIGLAGVDVGALSLSKEERASYCNSNWESENEKVALLLPGGPHYGRRGGRCVSHQHFKQVTASRLVSTF